MQLTNFFDHLKIFSFLGNSGYDYVMALVIFVGLIVILKIIKIMIVGRLRQLAKKTKTDFDDTLIEIFGRVKPPFYFFVALYFSVKTLDLPQVLAEGIKVFFIVVIVYEVIRGLEKFSDYFVGKYLSKMESEEDADQSQSMVKSANMIVKIILWVLGIILILANLGINVTSIVASLGIGGLAVALALQNILSDIFSSFSIYIDKPFRVGDFIVLGEHSGNVERIGLKTTRIRTLQGEELVVSNKELTTARVQNFKKMEKRRVAFSLGIVYDTPSAKLEKIPSIIQEIIANTKDAEFDRCHFKEYSDSSLDFEIVFYVDSGEYDEYMGIRQQINLEIYKKFAKEKIEFAYPTQTVFLNKNK